jgi:hypothetical protein
VSGDLLQGTNTVTWSNHHVTKELLQGKLLKKFHDGFPGLLDGLTDVIVEKHQLKVEDLPSWEEGNGCKGYVARLCRELTCALPLREGSEFEVDESGTFCAEPIGKKSGFDKSKDNAMLDLVCTFDHDHTSPSRLF